jgi:hypothetical protein
MCVPHRDAACSRPNQIVVQFCRKFLLQSDRSETTDDESRTRAEYVNPRVNSADSIDDAMEAMVSRHPCPGDQHVGPLDTVVLQATVEALTGSVALLGDTIHNVADASPQFRCPRVGGCFSVESAFLLRLPLITDLPNRRPTNAMPSSQTSDREALHACHTGSARTGPPDTPSETSYATKTSCDDGEGWSGSDYRGPRNGRSGSCLDRHGRREKRSHSQLTHSMTGSIG